MIYILPILFVLFFLLIARLIYRKQQQQRREKLIREYPIPNVIAQKVQAKYPHLTPEQAQQVIAGLREYFQVCNLAGKRIVSMPSQAVDVAWHEFILFTKSYQDFCNKTLGRFLHHTPAEAMQSKTLAQEGIKTIWKISCNREGININKPHKLPTLFAIDAALNIPDGFKYSLNCKRNNDYCASHIGCSSGCGGSSCGSDSSSCGSGCGGD